MLTDKRLHWGEGGGVKDPRSPPRCICDLNCPWNAILPQLSACVESFILENVGDCRGADISWRSFYRWLTHAFLKPCFRAPARRTYLGEISSSGKGVGEFSFERISKFRPILCSRRERSKIFSKGSRIRSRKKVER